MAVKNRWLELILPIGIIASVLVILIPLPAAVLDLLLAANITLAVIILLGAVYVKTPLEFAIFPTLLLVTTLGRLVLNISTTRLILSRGATDQSSAAGGVIESFGEFVAGNQIAVGMIIFGIIVIVQFVVITAGSTRISEVAARFTLDAMPGRQMAIDADLNASLIDHETARQRRSELEQQADFYGAMDGASKFVRGDAIAGLLITGINIAGGLAIGLSSGMSLSVAGETFTKLTIGDGLATQLPALLIALAAGILISRSGGRVDLPSAFLKQTFARAPVMVIAGCFLLALTLTQLPTVPLVSIAALCFYGAWMLSRPPRQAPPSPQTQESIGSETKDISSYLQVDPLELELGAGLVALANTAGGGRLLQEISRTRQKVAEQLGLVLPKVRVRDNLDLAHQEYRLLINQLPVCQGRIHADQSLVLPPPGTDLELQGERATWPDTNKGLWIQSALTAQVPEGCIVLSPEAAIAEHLLEVAKQHAERILTRQSTAYLIDQLRKHTPAVVEELIPTQLGIGQVQQVLQCLLAERVSIRQLGVILEALSNHHAEADHLGQLAELVRRHLANWITAQSRDERGVIRAIGITDELREWIEQRMEYRDGYYVVPMPKESLTHLCDSLRTLVEHQPESLASPVLLVDSAIRPAIYQLVRKTFPSLRVLGHLEITPEARIEKIAVLSHRDVEYCAA